MPKEKPYVAKNIPSFYRCSAIDLLMFAHMTALNSQGMKLEDAFEDWKKCYGIEYDEYDFESGMKTYYRMRSKFQFVKLQNSLDSSNKSP